MSAYITVTDAAGHVLFRRRATADEIRTALDAAQLAEAEARAVMERFARETRERDRTPERGRHVA